MDDSKRIENPQREEAPGENERENHHRALEVAKQALQESEENLRLAKRIFENSNEAIVITDRTNRILRVNEAFTRITGYSIDEVKGKDPGVMKSGRHDREFYSALWKSLKEKGEWQGEIWDRRKNGEIYPKWASISVVRDEEGRITHYVGTFSDITIIKATEENLEHLAHYDVLTGLPNRILFRERLQRTMVRTDRNLSQAALLFLDLDSFKYINDTMGHETGDLLLKEVGSRLSHCMIREDDTVSRLGGDEFTIILEDLKSPEDAAVVGHRIIESFRTPFLLGGRELFITTSIGIALYPGDGENPEVLTKNADAAMYHAKDQGKNNYQFYSQKLNRRNMERLELETALRRALEKGNFLLHYQPRVSLSTGKITGMEALVRWRDDTLGLVPPGRFIPLAEESGLIVAIGNFVLREACRRTRLWHEAGFPDLRVAVNMSARQFIQKNLVETIAATVRDTGIDPRLLELELTESTVMHDTESAVRTIDEIKAMGIHLSIDDFGTGYSSLNYLKRFAVHSLKIDKSFIDEVPSNADDNEITRAIIALAHNLQMKVVAEGVETDAQLSFLQTHGCDEIQGYLFSRPLPEEDLDALLNRNPEFLNVR